MKCIVASLAFIVGCRFDLPEALPDEVDAPTDVSADAPTDASPDAPITGCPADYTPLSGASAGHRYKRIVTQDTWVVQSAACSQTSTSAYLAIPDDASELAALYAFVGGDLFWVGVNDMAAEGMYVTVLGSPATFLPWASNEPDGTTYPSEDCVVAVSSILDIPCNVGGYEAVAVCECEP